MDKNWINSFSVEYWGIVNKLLINVSILDAGSWEELAKCIWLIDTWATWCVISNVFAQKLWLISVWFNVVCWVSWPYNAPTYSLKLKLPNNFVTSTLLVTWWPLEIQQIDFLIWMDVISNWDFSITTKDWKTFVSFVTPHQATIDFVKEYSAKNMTYKKFAEEKEKRKNWNNNRKKKNKRKK